jgi:diacylglycerol kinase (ATP)
MELPQPSAAIIVNPASGNGQAEAVGVAVNQYASSLGYNTVVCVPNSKEEALLETRRLATSTDRVVVVGGDGMVHLGFNACAQQQAVLGVVPTGTGNDFARALGIPVDPVAATAVAFGDVHTMGGLKASDAFGNSVWVATVATAGFSVAVNNRASKMARPKGSSKYTLASIRESVKLGTWNVDCLIDGKRHKAEVLMIAMANTSTFGGGMRIAPDADPFSDKFSLVIIGKTNRRTFLRLLPKVFSGAHVNHPAVTTMLATSLEVEIYRAEVLQEVQADGERLESTMTKFELVPNVVKLACNN